ncbi:MAG TPA: prolyl oligopeptidase family serine peptidase [Pyrinomonadaceae bacterium]|nr:prolyl oligopeptidase family serine peptidase [Pyrinomonadaceae bacterium]
MTTRTLRGVAAAALLLLCAHTAPAQSNAVAKPDGTIIESAPYQLPTHAQLPANLHSAYSHEAVEKIRTAADLELLKITYMSDGLKIAGFIYKPKRTEGQKLPAIIFNRGGLADGAIGPENFNYLYEMHRYASEGFVVIASQYRGAGGSEGKDEAAGADTNDVMSLIPLARSLPYVDMNRLFMWGYSRGAMMTLQALKRGAPVRAVAVVGAPTDLTANVNNPGFIQFARAVYPDFDARRDEHLKNRSAILWVDKIEVPLLIMHGGADPGTPPTHAINLAQKLEEQGKTYELVVYARDNHGVFRNAEDRLRRTVDWFKNVRAMSIAQVLGRTVREQGAEAAVKQYHELKRTRPDVYDFAEPELNTLGYLLLRDQRVRDAIEIFKLNVAAYPEGFNTYDSLGEAYLAAGERELAIQNYKKSLELNPRNTNATDVLKRIEGQE